MLSRLVMSAYHREGLWYVMKQGVKYLAKLPYNLLAPWYHRIGRKQTFMFQGEQYKYFYHAYNTTWNNPRAIEVPIIQRFIDRKRTLEVGCVLPHYISYHHDVVDLNEKYPDVINQDIADFKPNFRYDLVVSISTFEHIGDWGDEPKQPEKFLLAVHNVISKVLGIGGHFVLTLPLGQNRDMDRYIYDGEVKFGELYCMRQIDIKHNYWAEDSWEQIRREFRDGEWCGTQQVILIGVMS